MTCKVMLMEAEAPGKPLAMYWVLLPCVSSHAFISHRCMPFSSFMSPVVSVFISSLFFFGVVEISVATCFLLVFELHYVAPSCFSFHFAFPSTRQMGADSHPLWVRFLQGFFSVKNMNVFFLSQHYFHGLLERVSIKNVVKNLLSFITVLQK